MEAVSELLLSWLASVLDFILHIDVRLDDLTEKHGWQTYLILFAVVFWETGVVIWPFLPGDSLLFAAGAIAAREASPLSPAVLIPLLITAAFLGDTANYWIGNFFGPRVLNRDGRFLKKKYLDKTRDFYDRHGAKTIVLARFVPVVRTFAPFVAGVGSMRYRRFLGYNVIGGAAWTILFVGAGYLFGTHPFVRKNFTLVILAIIVVSILPMAIEFARAKRKGAPSASAPTPAPSAAAADLPSLPARGTGPEVGDDPPGSPSAD
jgi:membrane-associated protein